MRTFHSYNIDKLKDPQDASLYLTEALIEFEKDHDIKSFLKILKDVTEAQGGIGELAKKTNLNRQNLYKLLLPNDVYNCKLYTVLILIYSIMFFVYIAYVLHTCVCIAYMCMCI